MKKTITRKQHIIDADGKSLGRIASEIALLLQGKRKTIFERHRDVGDYVIVKNIKHIKFTGSKFQHKRYYHHSGYPGGLKSTPLKELFQKKPGEVLRKAVWNMLPKNSLRKKFIQRLKIEEK